MAIVLTLKSQLTVSLNYVGHLHKKAKSSQFLFYTDLPVIEMANNDGSQTAIMQKRVFLFIFGLPHLRMSQIFRQGT